VKLYEDIVLFNQPCFSRHEPENKSTSNHADPMNCYDRQARMLRCNGCGETRPLFSRSLQNPERFVSSILEPFLHEHAKCESYKDQHKARRAILWARGLRKADAETQARKRFDRIAARLRAITERRQQDVDVVVSHAQVEALAKRWGARLV
jgi:hypothetical protein